MSDSIQQFIDGAIKTESRIDHVFASPEYLHTVLASFIQAAEELDDLKKGLYYGSYAGHEHPAPAMRVDVDPRLFHAALGKATEAGELIEAFYKHLFNNVDLDLVNCDEEIGDSYWYDAVWWHARSQSAKTDRGSHEAAQRWIRCFERIIAKLKKRYREKFTTEAANNRDLEAERQVLESEPQTDTQGVHNLVAGEPVQPDRYRLQIFTEDRWEYIDNLCFGTTMEATERAGDMARHGNGQTYGRVRVVDFQEQTVLKEFAPGGANVVLEHI